MAKFVEQIAVSFKPSTEVALYRNFYKPEPLTSGFWKVVFGNNTLVEMWDAEYDQNTEGIHRLEFFQKCLKTRNNDVYPKFQMAVE